MKTIFHPQSERERGTALVMVIIFTFLAVAGSALFLTRSHIELRDSKYKNAAVKGLFNVHSALGRAHRVINDSVSQGPQINVALDQPEVYNGIAYITDTNRNVRVRTVTPSSLFDANGNELPPVGGYQPLPISWYLLEARMFEPLFSLSDGSTRGMLKMVRQYVRDGTPLSNNFLAVIDDDLGLGGSPVNPGRPADGEIITNGHLYIMTANPYYANRLLSVEGVSYIAGATESNTVYLHPDNNFAADPLVMPLPDSLTSNDEDPDDTLKAHSLGSAPVPVSLLGTNPNYSVTMNGVSSASELNMSGGDPTPTMDLNFGDSGNDPCQGLCVEGNIDTRVTLQGDSMTVRMIKGNNSSKWIEVSGLPTPDNGAIFFDTRVDVGGVNRRTELQGEVTTRTTLATTGNVDISGSIQYYDDDGDGATKLVYSTDLDGVPEEDWGNLPDIPDSTIIPTNVSVEYFANERPYGLGEQPGDGFYDGNSVLGVVASQDVIILESVPQNAEMSGSYLALVKRLTLNGMGYNSDGQLVWINGASDFYIYNGGRSSIRRFGGLISNKRPATAVVTWTGALLYGFRRGFSLFDEKMRQHPPPYFPKDKRPQYLGWELKDLGLKTVQ